jgi:hypothetical protein
MYFLNKKYVFYIQAMSDEYTGELPIWAVIMITSAVSLLIGFFCGWCCRKDIMKYNAQRAAAERASRLTRTSIISA